MILFGRAVKSFRNYGWDWNITVFPACSMTLLPHSAKGDFRDFFLSGHKNTVGECIDFQVILYSSSFILHINLEIQLRKHLQILSLYLISRFKHI